MILLAFNQRIFTVGLANHRRIFLSISWDEENLGDGALHKIEQSTEGTYRLYERESWMMTPRRLTKEPLEGTVKHADLRFHRGRRHRVRRRDFNAGWRNNFGGTNYVNYRDEFECGWVLASLREISCLLQGVWFVWLFFGPSIWWGHQRLLEGDRGKNWFFFTLFLLAMRLCFTQKPCLFLQF